MAFKHLRITTSAVRNADFNELMIVYCIMYMYLAISQALDAGDVPMYRCTRSIFSVHAVKVLKISYIK